MSFVLSMLENNSTDTPKTQKNSLVQENNRPPSHPLRSLNSPKASEGLSLSFSRTILLGEGPQVAEKMVVLNPSRKKASN